MTTEHESNEDKPLGRRVLAAVMFTDVVGFSRTVGEDEERGLRLTGRDLDLIGELVRMFDGRVLKSTGDGVLALFTSGVQAVSCAQEIQKQLAEQAQTLPPEEVLEHRIGIHLGDVYVSGNEVMGDGVNIAARLQSEAPPGGIAITQALYEVARTRLSFKTVHMGARQLKNIPEAVQVYQVLLDPSGRTAGRRLASMLRRPGTKLAVGSIGLLVIVLAAVLLALHLADDRRTGETETDPAAAALAEYPKVKTEHLKTRDYAGLAGWIEEHDLEESDSALHDDFVRYRKLGELFDWLEGQLAGYTKDNPLAVQSLRVGTMKIWSTGDELTLKIDGRDDQVTSMRLAPNASFVLNVMRAVAAEKWKGGRVVRGSAGARLLEGMVLFARENNLQADGLLSALKRPKAEASDDAGSKGKDGDVFIRFDRDKDGRLTADELPRLIRDRLMRADRNNDGVLTLEELRESRKRAPVRRIRRPAKP